VQTTSNDVRNFELLNFELCYSTNNQVSLQALLPSVFHKIPLRILYKNITVFFDR